MESEKKDIFDRIMTLPLFRKFQKPYKKYKSIFLYILFGGCTTVISIGSFVVFDVWLNINELIANAFSWILAVMFAYLTNRTWVFTSSAKGMKLIKEMLAFFAGRLFTLGIEETLMLVFVTVLSFNSIVVKTLGQIVVLVLNYLISKIFVFRLEEMKNAEKD